MTYLNKLDENLKKIKNKKNILDGLFFMSMFQECCVPAVFFDPQYRGIIDKMKYGNEGSRQKDRFNLIQMNEEKIREFIMEINRVLMPSGHLFLWIDKFYLVEGTKHFFKDSKLLLVDMIVWDKGRIGMGYRTRRKSEYLLIFQKYPKRVKGCWNLHNIPDIWQEKINKDSKKHHVHAKPINLQSKLIESVVQINDFVLDPASGSYSVMQAALNVNRNFLGCDIMNNSNETLF